MMASRWIGSRPASKRVSRRRTRQKRMRSAGPAENADARKRGARIAVIQNGRAARPEKRNAVTVWMLTADGIERMMIGLIQGGGATALRSASSGTCEIRVLRTR